MSQWIGKAVATVTGALLGGMLAGYVLEDGKLWHSTHVAFGVADRIKPEPITPEEEGAVAMIQMGYDRWVVACAYQTAKDGGTLEQARNDCVVDFHLPKLKDDNVLHGKVVPNDKR